MPRVRWVALLASVIAVVAPGSAIAGDVSPVAAYSFDAGEGAVAEDVFGENDGAIEGASWFDNGRFGKALSFDGEDDLVSIPGNADLQLEEFTVEAWVKPSATTLLAPVVAKLDDEDWGYALYGGGDNAAGRPQGYILEGKQISATAYDDEELPENVWSHIAVTNDGGHIRLYVNGELVDKEGVPDVKAGGEGPLQIGGNEAFEEEEFFEGLIDEVRIYNRGLNENEIAGDMSAGLQTPSRPPVAAYSFDAGEGAVAEDLFGEHNGAIEGASWFDNGRFGEALSFDAEDDCVTVEDAPDLQLTEEFTLETWIKPQGPDGTWEPILFKEAGPWGAYSIWLGAEPGKVEGYVVEEGEEVKTAVTEGGIGKNIWAHVALTYDGAWMRLYIDGELVDSTHSVGLAPSEGPLQIGCTLEAEEYFGGLIDEVRIYNRALGAGEVAADMSAGLQTPSRSPVAAYSLDAGEGAVAEDLFGEHNGAIEGAGWFANGRFGQALTFDGENDCITVEDAPDLQLTEEFTLEAWVRPEDEIKYDPIIAKEAEGFFSYYLGLGVISNGKVEGYIADSEEEVTLVRSPEPLAANVWSHVALTYDGAYMRLYLDGELVDTTAIAVGNIESNGPLHVGCYPEFNEHFDGLIDEVRIYNRALGAGEVAADMSAGLQTPSRPPVAAYSFDAGEGAVAEDLFGENDGAIEGAEWFDKGKFGSALYFDGSEGDLVTVPDSNNLDLTDEFTLEAWVRPDEANEWSAVITKERGGALSYQMHAEGEGNAPAGFVQNSEGNFEVEAGDDPIPPRVWSHLTMTYDGQKLRYYINGEFMGEDDSGDPGISEDPLFIGGNDNWGEEDAFKGLIDEVRIYNRALGENEVAGDMTAGLQTPSRSPIAAYAFDAGESAVAEDVFGEHDGAIEGATWFDNGRFGKALSFDGTNDCLSAPNDPALQLTEEFTLEAWIKSRGTGTWEPILSKNDAYSIWLGEEPGHLRSYIREEDENEALAIDPNGIDENVWAHVAVTFDGQWMRLYVNGEFADKAWSEGAATTASPLSIGCAEEPHEGHFEGLIDEVRVYNRALGAAEVTRDRSTPVPIPPTAVTGEAEVFAPNEALLMGVVNPGGLETGYYFEYGPTTEYGEVAPAIEEEVVGGREDLDAEEAIPYLTPGTTYHYRTVAYNRAGTAVGADQTFTTPSAEESPEEEAKKRENEQDCTTEISKLGSEFVNLNFSGLGLQDRSSEGLEKLANTGAGMIRVSIENLNTFDVEKPLYDDFILNAAANDLKILFVLGSKHIPVGSDRYTFRKQAEEIVRRYGKAHFKQNKSLWGEERAENMGVDKVSNAIDSWEIWNEPNIGLNSVKRPFSPEEGKVPKPERERPGPVDPEEFGEFLQVMSNGIRNVEKNATVIVGGLVLVGTVWVNQEIEKEEIKGVEDEVNPQQFLRKMGHFSAYNAVGFHPYVFRPKKKVALGPVNDGEIEKVRMRVRGAVSTLRRFLNRPKIGAEDKKIWISEIGWPVDFGDEPHPSVTKGIQAKLVNKVFCTIETMRGPNQWNVANVFYYNYRDVKDSREWDQNMGLVDDELKGRPALDVFRIHAF